MARSKQIARKSTGGLSPRSAVAAQAVRTTPRQVMKPKKHRPGIVAVREIRKYQKSVDLLLPKAAFRRLCKEVLQGATQTSIDD
ncbi:hypothetical protein KFL_015130010, partial [Klebsormidium nitens]